MSGKYISCPKGNIDRENKKENFSVDFFRWYEDDSLLCDAYNGRYKATDELCVVITSYITTYEKSWLLKAPVRRRKRKERIEITTKSKQLANWIWYAVEKKGYGYKELKELYKAHVFEEAKLIFE